MTTEAVQVEMTVTMGDQKVSYIFDARQAETTRERRYADDGFEHLASGIYHQHYEDDYTFKFVDVRYRSS